VIILISIISIVATLLTWLIVHYASRASRLLDHPGERTSHHTPTPRGGGWAFVVMFTLGMVVFGVWDMLSWYVIGGITLSSWLVALVGWLDDYHGHVHVGIRLAVHALATVMLVVMLPNVWVWSLVAIGAVIWCINLFNFMDGINGIVGLEVVSVALAAAFLLDNPTHQWLCVLLAGAVLGFVVWNFPKAQVFMGDVGSGYLGLVSAALVLLTSSDMTTLVMWLILLAVFITDASMTLLRRILQGERFYEAHCAHAFQHAARQYQSHTPVTLAVVAINLLFLTPIATLVQAKIIPAWLGLGGAYVPLILLGAYWKAGISRANP
jgi:Fuc2NAc and GlcNAc transferase